MSPRRDILEGGVSPQREPVSPRSTSEDERVEASLRPKSLHDFVGQRDLIGHLEIVLTAARQRNQAVDHLLLALLGDREVEGGLVGGEAEERCRCGRGCRCGRVTWLHS